MYFSGKSLIKEMPWCCRNPVCVVQFSCIHGEGAVVTCDVMTHSMHKTAQRQEVSISRGLAEACQRHHGQRHDFFSEKKVSNLALAPLISTRKKSIYS